MTGKTPTTCQFCYATVAADVMGQHEAWHKANDLHSDRCQKAGQETTVHLTPLPCNCGLK